MNMLTVVGLCENKHISTYVCSLILANVVAYYDNSIGQIAIPSKGI